MNALYADGGVINRNPSPVGGTWAFRIISNGEVVCEKSDTITPAQAKMPEITNNFTEMCALIAGLKALPDDWIGTVYSDSQVTLGRVFEGWKWNGIPTWLREMYEEARRRLKNWDRIEHVLLDGHPTKAQLEAGKGKRGHPVSIHNVWADHACGEEARKFMEKQP